jgi:hypothetical protein
MDHHHQGMDHMGHHHDQMAMESSAPAALDYDYQHQAPLTAHGASNMDHAHMKHGHMDHGTMDSQAMDHSAMGHGSMDHDDMGHMGSMSGHSMMMYFHGGYEEVILFDFWRINTVGGLIGSMIGCFLLAMSYEGLKFLREIILRKNFSAMRSCCSGENDEDHEEAANGAAVNGRNRKSEGSVQTLETSIWSMVRSV